MSTLPVKEQSEGEALAGGGQAGALAGGGQAEGGQDGALAGGGQDGALAGGGQDEALAGGQSAAARQPGGTVSSGGPAGSGRPNLRTAGGDRVGGVGSEADSPQYERYLRVQKRKLFLVWASRLAVLALFLLAWQLAADWGWIDPMLTSKPSALASGFRELAFDGNLFMHTRVTAVETVISMAVSMVLGAVIAILLWWSSFASKVLEPYMVVLNALPKVALGPIFYIWLGDRYSIYGMAIAISLIVTIIMAESGFKEISKSKLKLMESLGASRLQMLRMVLLPASIPNMIATLKVNVGLTLVGVVMGEFLSSKAGLGYLIIYGGQVFQMNMVMVSIAMLAVMSVALYAIVNMAGQYALKVYHFER